MIKGKSQLDMLTSDGLLDVVQSEKIKDTQCMLLSVLNRNRGGCRGTMHICLYKPKVDRSISSFFGCIIFHCMAVSNCSFIDGHLSCFQFLSALLIAIVTFKLCQFLPQTVNCKSLFSSPLPHPPHQPKLHHNWPKLLDQALNWPPNTELPPLSEPSIQHREARVIFLNTDIIFSLPSLKTFKDSLTFSGFCP